MCLNLKRFLKIIWWRQCWNAKYLAWNIFLDMLNGSRGVQIRIIRIDAHSRHSRLRVIESVKTEIPTCWICKKHHFNTETVRPLIGNDDVSITNISSETLNNVQSFNSLKNCSQFFICFRTCSRIFISYLNFTIAQNQKGWN